MRKKKRFIKLQNVRLDLSKITGYWGTLSQIEEGRGQKKTTKSDYSIFVITEGQQNLVQVNYGISKSVFENDLLRLDREYSI